MPTSHTGFVITHPLAEESELKTLCGMNVTVDANDAPVLTSHVEQDTHPIENSDIANSHPNAKDLSVSATEVEDTSEPVIPFQAEPIQRNTPPA